MDSGTHHIRRLLGLVAVLGALSLAGGGVVACGGGDDDARDTGDTAGQAQSKPGASDETAGRSDRDRTTPKPSAKGAQLTGDVEEARKGVAAIDDVYSGVGAALESGIASTDVPEGKTLKAAEDNESLARACDLMSEQTKAQAISNVKKSSGLTDVDWTCEKAIGLLLRRARQSGDVKGSLRTKIVAVDVKGDRGKASVRFGDRRKPSTVTLVKEDGRWKVGAPPAGDDQ